jgi:ABC-type transport system involved in cytochrome c biogenesis permease component
MRLLGLRLSVTNTLPLVGRELRAESRRAINYGLRVLTAAVVVSVFAAFMAGTEMESAQLGATLFGVLQLSLWLAMWIIVPMMTADCISREKREGTLGLLFLTPLTVLDVMMGKAASHILRAATLLLASLPVLVLPFVIGGVVWQQALMAVVSIAKALLLSIAAGLYASAKAAARFRSWSWRKCTPWAWRSPPWVCSPLYLYLWRRICRFGD